MLPSKISGRNMSWSEGGCDGVMNVGKYISMLLAGGTLGLACGIVLHDSFVGGLVTFALISILIRDVVWESKE